MKRCILIAMMVFAGISLFAQETEEESQFTSIYAEKKWPSAKRPQTPSSEKLNAAAQKNIENATEEYVEETKDTFSFGMTSQIETLMQSLTADEDCRFVNEAYDLFQETKSPRVRELILAYFAKLEDPCLEDFAVEVINEPFDYRNETITACFEYVSAVKTKDAIPGIVAVLESEDSEFFNYALTALGQTGGTQEALYLSDYIDRDDLTLAQRQQLMRVLGQLKAVETWDKLSEIAQDTDENMYVRAYAAEAIGAMEVPDSEEILIDLYEATEPIIREYVVRGLSHYTSENTRKVIKQALKDDNYRVRLEALSVVESQNITECAKDLVYHCKTKEETVVKEKCYKVLAKLNTADGNEYLVSVLKDKKAGDSAKAKVAAALLENGSVGTKEIVELASSTLKDDKSKSLRYALGKEIAKYSRSEFAGLCSEYLASKDVMTQGTGLDMFATGRYESARKAVQDLAALAPDENDTDSKTRKPNNVNATKAKKILAGMGSK
ncbi:MAG: HEAT repeat domain-containing protein [Treponema sp.]|nr:HEAT repeat domain-containing protein [Treponema sp.]